MNNRLSSDEQNFLNLFSKEASKPDSRFKENLKKEMLYTFNKKQSWFSFGAPQFALLSIMLFAFVLMIGGVSFLINFNANKIEPVKNFTQEEKNAILEKIIKSNSTNVLEKAPVAEVTSIQNQPQTQATTPTTPVVTQPSQTILPPVTVKPESTEYNYRYTKITNKNGPAIGVCPTLTYLNDEAGVSESFEYFGTDTTYNKVKSTNKDNTLKSYSLLKTTAGATEYTTYQGGSYAARMQYTDETDMPTSYPSSYTVVQDQGLVGRFFGSNTDISNIAKINGKEYYILQDKYEQPCNYTTPASYPTSYSTGAENNRTLIYQYYIDTQTFEVVKVETYIDSVTSGNLVNSIETSIQKKKVDFKDVSGDFSFEYNVPIKDVATKDSDVLSNYLQNNMINILSEETHVIDSFYANYPNLNYKFNWYLYDRDFYPNTKAGQSQYDDFTKFMFKPQPLITMTENGSSAGSKVYMDIYSTNEDEAKIFAARFYTNNDYKVTTDSINIDGKKVNANIYQFTTNINDGVAPAMQVDCTKQKCLINHYVAIFTFESKKYALFTDPGVELNLKNWKFKSLNASEDADLAIIMGSINKLTQK